MAKQYPSLDFRDSALPRIATGTTLLTILGTYSGHILYSVHHKNQEPPSHLLRKGVPSLSRQFKKAWFTVSLTCSLAFFSLNELAHWYFERSDFYHNYFTDYTISAYAVYRGLHPYLRRHEMLQEYTTLQIRDKAQKYCLIICLIGLTMECYLALKRQSLILASLKLDDANICPYLLKDTDMLLLKRMIVAKQLPMWSFHKAHEGDIGSFVPIAIMHQAKRQEVEESNQEMNRKLSSAIKRLISTMGDGKRGL
ncbi:hypothetical protein FGO68_gene9137 [Halteria grandinella]|uniref:Uncharacterized protein n=1 Tax=Halteria grandinella TaxID=5974 RepID=A0A8J8NGL7_HALGN|nr:hypothetical protein FGO68_gene9137 [Halteria grandinella]